MSIQNKSNDNDRGILTKMDSYIFFFTLIILATLVVSQYSHLQSKKETTRLTDSQMDEWAWVEIQAGDDDLCLAVIKDELIDPTKEYSDEYVWGLVMSKNNWQTREIHRGDKFLIPIKKEKVELIKKIEDNPIFKTPEHVKYKDT